MAEEFSVLQRQGTWSPTPVVLGKNAVGCKCLYRIKYHPNRSIARYKARLVAKGFHEQKGLDYDETFSLIVKQATIMVILSLAIHFGLTLHQ